VDRFAGQFVLVTGGASGIGAKCAERFLQEGARVVIADLAPEAAIGFEGYEGTRLRLCRHDVSSEASWRQLLGEMAETWGVPDVLVNSAGIMQPGDIETTPYQAFEKAMDVNAGGVFLGCQNVVKAMRAVLKRGAIVNVASTTALKPAQWVVAYSASKAAVVSLTRTVALHCARSGSGIRCNAVLPGAVMTPMVGRLIDAAPDRDAALAALEFDHPIGRLVETVEVAAMVAYLASSEAAGITGASMVVDGGLTAG
jgi:NAD(P)-dependent dehydrogenase (short-subunit alcohol dehydrogenase family)